MTLTQYEYSQAYYHKNREKLLAKSRAYKKSRPEYYIWQAAKHRAKKNGRDFSIGLNDIYIPATCPILNKPIILGDKVYAPSLDRIDNSKGYVVGNIRVISKLANRLKKELTPELCLIFYDYMTKD